MTVALAVIIGIVVLGTLLLFPVVGIAMLPIVVLAVLVGIAWLVLASRRGPESLPERRLPDEDEL